MTARAAISRFLRCCDDLSEVCISHPWGTVTRNSSFPHVHDANHAWVFDEPTPTVNEVREAMSALQGVSAVPYLHVEVVDTDARPELVSGLTAWLGAPRDHFAVMATSAAPPAAVSEVLPGTTVSEQPFPARDQWLALIAEVHADEEPLPPSLLDELATRDTTTLASAGARFFTVATAGVEVVAHASLLSLQGVGLIDHVATLPAWRNRGAATAVVAAALAASAAEGNEAAFLFTRDGSSAQRVYDRLGMRVLARAAQFRRDHASGSDQGTGG